MPEDRLRHRSGPLRATNGSTADIHIGVVGLGLMGMSIIACLLAAGHPVTAITRSVAKHKHARRHILALLKQMVKQGILQRDPSRGLLEPARFSNCNRVDHRRPRNQTGRVGSD